MEYVDRITHFDAASRRIGIALLSIAAAGCGQNTAAPVTPAALAVASGGAQSGTVASALAAQVAVKVTDQNGTPVSGVNVTFTPTANSGSVSAAQATTNLSGVAQVAWTLGTKAGADSLTATTGALTTVIVATATAGTPTQVLPVAGAGQTGAAGSTLSVPLSVIVLDAFGNAVPNALVAWTDNAAGVFANGYITPTNSSGVAAASYTLGPSSGVNTVYASVGAAGATRFATFTEQGT